MKNKFRQVLFTAVICLGVSASLYVHFVLMGYPESELIRGFGEMTGESSAYLPDWHLIVHIGEAIKDLFIQAA